MYIHVYKYQLALWTFGKFIKIIFCNNSLNIFFLIYNVPLWIFKKSQNLANLRVHRAQKQQVSEL